MPSRKRTSSVLNGDTDHHGDDAVAPTAPDQVLALELAEAEAEAAEAEAMVAAARARARALKLRRQAEEAAASSRAATTDVAEPAEVEPSEAVEIDGPQPTTEPGSSADDSGDVDEVEVEDAEQDDGPVRRRRLALPRIRLKVVAAALVVLLTVGLLAASAWMTFHHRQVVAEQQRSAEFAAAARQGVVTLMSLNFNSAADDVKRIIESATGDFKKDFESQAADFTKAAQDSKVITEANVNALAVKSMTQDSATVLVAVTTNVSNAASKEQQPRSWRLSVNVAREGGQIKLAKVEFVP